MNKPPADPGTSGGITPPARWSFRWLFHLLALWSFAFAQPLYSKVSENLPFLLSHRIDGAQLIAYALGVLLLPPLLLWAGTGLVALLSRRLALITNYLIFLVLASLVLLPLCGAAGLPDVLAIALAVSLALILALLHQTRVLQGLLDFLAVAPVVFVAFFLFIGPASALLSSGNEAQAPDENHPDHLETPVVVLLLDELPLQALLDANGQLDSERLPGFARLAETSTWYPRATTVVEATIMAAPVFLSGILPIHGRHQPPLWQNFPENIFDQVSAQRRIRAIENGSRLCRPGRCTLGMDTDRDLHALRWKTLAADSLVVWGHITLPASLGRRWLPELGTRWSGFAVANATAALSTDESGPHQLRWGQRSSEFAAFLAALGDLGPDTLYYQHLLLPHAPWIYLPDGRTYDISRSESISGMMPEHANTTGIKHQWWDSEWATVIAEQRFMLQIAYVDSLLQELMERLEESDYFEDLMLIVAADHGGAFTPGTSRRALTLENFGEILPIPLFIKYPGQLEGRVDERPAELLDVSPSLRRALGLSLDGLDGQALQDKPADRFEPRLVNEHGEVFQFSADEYWREFHAALKRRQQRLELDPAGNFVRVGPHRTAYGQQIDAYASISTEPSEHVFVTADLSPWQAYSLKSSPVPARLVGRLQGPDAQDSALFATLNGRIAGYAQPYGYPGAEGLTEFILWPALLVEGDNNLRIWEIAKDGEQTVLHPVKINIDSTSFSAASAADKDLAARTTEEDGLWGKWFFPAAMAEAAGAETPEVRLAGSWHPAGSQEIRWTDKQAGICLELQEPELRLGFAFSATPFLHPPELNQQRLIIEIEGRQVALLSLDQRGLFERQVDLGVIKSDGNNPVCVQLIFPDAQIPNEVGASPDRRMLGAAFLKFQFFRQG